MDMDSVTYAYISEPVEFRHLEGKAIDFRKTFDVRGRGTDEMLQLYLRKANLADDIDRMPALQRRAYVYDIIRSNKAPGYWVPPFMQASSDVFAQPPPAVLPPPTARTSPLIENRFGAVSASPKMKPSASSSSFGSMNSVQGALPGPSFATSVVVSNKGSKYEISGPVNFQHVSGDLVRDRTRNAFDLNTGANDNVLKKYMMERGITEEDIAGMRREDVVLKIVHSNFTWMPDRRNRGKPKTPTIVYATISTNNQITPPPSPPPVKQLPPATTFSNYATVTSRFVDISEMDVLPPQNFARQPEVGTVVPVKVQQPQSNGARIPPPPSAVTAANTRAYPAAIEVRPAPPKTQKESFATIATQPHRNTGKMRVPPPAPPKPTKVYDENENIYGSAGQVIPPPPQFMGSSAVPRAPAMQSTPMPKTPSVVNIPAPPTLKSAAPPPPAFKPAAAGVPPPPKFRADASGGPRPPPPVMIATGGAPPPPPPPPSAMGAPAPPPPPPSAMGAPAPPPPPPMGAAALPLVIAKSDKPKGAPAAEDNRDAFLESIRQGVSLKKVDKKAATLGPSSGIKVRPANKAPAMDFMSELKMGITLRRVKNPADNPYSDANNESAA